jgi:hypothetical protein
MAFATIRRLIRSRQARWLLVLALAWLPAAQWAASAHALLHLRGVSTSDTPGHLPAAGGLCLVAASVGGGGAPPAQVSTPVPPPAPQAIAIAPTSRFVSLATAAPYRSRAPPLPHA